MKPNEKRTARDMAALLATGALSAVGWEGSLDVFNYFSKSNSGLNASIPSVTRSEYATRLEPILDYRCHQSTLVWQDELGAVVDS